MLVDDNVDAAQSIAALLEMDGHEVQIAHDGAAALARLDGCADRRLPARHRAARNGSATSWHASCARDRRSRGALLIAVTGYGQATDRAKSALAGFDQHLVKPVDSAALRAALVER